LDELEFNQRTDEIIELIEERLDELDADLDYDNEGGVLSISFADNSKVIINRQAPLKQIWVAAKSGGFHFDFNADVNAWVKDDDGTELFAALSKYCSQQAGESIDLMGS